MASVQERPQHGRNRPPRMDLQHVLDMTWVEGDPVSTGAATMSEEENGDTQGLAAENNSQVIRIAIPSNAADLMSPSVPPPLHFLYCLPTPLFARCPLRNFAPCCSFSSAGLGMPATSTSRRCAACTGDTRNFPSSRGSRYR